MSEKGKSMALHNKILLSLVLGGVAGIGAQAVAAGNPAFKEQLDSILKNVIEPVGNIFLAMIFMIVVPLLLSALILGIAQIGDVARVGRIGLRTLAMTVLLSGIAVAIAFALVNLAKPGSTISPEQRDQLYAAYAKDGEKKLGIRAENAETAFTEAEAKELDGKIADAIDKAKPPQDGDPILGIVPRNPVLEASRALSGGILPFMFFALVLGLGLAKSDPEVVAPVRAFFEGIFEISQKVIEMAMALAPIGVFALVFKTGAALGIDIFRVLGVYAIVVLVGLGLHMIITYPVVLKLIAKRNPREFFGQIRNVMLTAFATSSSNATLPVALKAAEEEVGLPKDVSSFVLTVGATANQNGTALFEGITIIFFCQLFDVPLTAANQLMVLGVSIVAGIGTAGVPGGAWPVIGGIIKTLGVPAGAIGMALGIDRILDMSRTVLNVTGDITIAACVSEWEGRSTAVPESVQG